MAQVYALLAVIAKSSDNLPRFDAQHSNSLHLRFIRRFQSRRFLAHYVAMCPSNDSAANPEPKTTPLSNGVLQQQQTGQLAPAVQLSIEIGGREGLEPTRYGDWEKAGRCIDF